MEIDGLTTSMRTDRRRCAKLQTEIYEACVSCGRALNTRSHRFGLK
jgi:hypothetical protein